MSGQYGLDGIPADPSWEERRPGPAPEAEAHDILAQAIERHRPAAIYALFSGGNDSVCISHVAAQRADFTGCLTLLTGIYFEEWREHVCRTAAAMGWPLNLEHTPESYEALVLAEGFPGPAMHWKMYQRLKERAIRSFTKRVLEETGGPVLLVGGRRKQESPRRLRRLVNPIEVADPKTLPGVVFVSPAFWWSRQERDAYQAKYALPRNPVKENTGEISGDCACGAMADQGPDRSERRMIEVWYPEMHHRLSCLEAMAAARGVWPVWGVKPPASYSRAMRENQCSLVSSLYLCTGCEARAEADHAAAEAA